MMTAADPHANQPVLHHGPKIADARLVAIMLHGRGAGAEDILGLAREFSAPDVAYVAPQAAGRTWYPYSFLTAMEQNEPFLASALRRVETLVAELHAQQVPSNRIALMGFSQGACLSLEFAARHAQRYAVIAGFSGGVIGPPGTPRNYTGAFDGTPVFLGCSDVDPHIPVERVHETADLFSRLGARVDTRIYPQMAHTITGEEIDVVDALLESL
jgi:predicted esterase